MRRRDFLCGVLTSALPCHPCLASSSPNFALFGPTFDWTPKAGDAVVRTLNRARGANKRPPSAIPYIHMEGTLPGQGVYDASLQAVADFPIVLDFSLAWKLTNDRVFLAQAVKYIASWAEIYTVSLNPVDETVFDNLILAHDLTKADRADQGTEQMKTFCERISSGYLNAMETRRAKYVSSLTNNWQSHRVKLATLAAFQVGSPQLIDRARAAFQAQIGANLHADGTTADFAERDALHYVLYSLEPLLMAALAAKVHGQDWYDFRAPSGASLSNTLDWLDHFASGERIHVEFMNSKVSFDQQRAQTGIAAFQKRPWDRSRAVTVYTLASLFDVRRRAMRDQLLATSERRPSDWLILFENGYS